MRFVVKEEKEKGLLDSIYDQKKRNYREHKLKFLFLELTLRCNARCEHCGSSCGDFIPKDEVTADEIKGVLDDIAAHYNPDDIMLNVTGGEPLVRKDLFDIMAYADSLGFSWTMTTNGILIDEEVVKKMEETHMYSVSVSLDGVKETHESFRRVPNSYEKILHGLKLMEASPVIQAVQVTTCVNKKNIDELPEIYKVVKNTGIHNWRIIEVDPIGRAKGNKDLLLDSDDLKRMFRFMFELRRNDPDMIIMYGCGHFWGNRLNQELIHAYYTCFTGFWVASILSNGDIFGCPDIERIPELIEGNIRKDSFVDVWEHRFKKYRSINRTSNSKCKKCPDWKVCTGDAFHTWDFHENKPNMCVREIFQEEYKQYDAMCRKFEKIKKELKKDLGEAEKRKSKKKKVTANI